MSFAIPAQRLHETDTLLAFYHPSPSYAVHILIVPKQAVADVKDLTAEHSQFMLDLFNTVSRLVTQLNLEDAGYRLITNGGAYQDVAHLHFHLVSGDAVRQD